jgi:putative SOS response-associated peptidase YedK
MAGIHDRMPVILREENYDRWLRTDAVGPKEAAALLVPYTAEGMQAYPVSTRVNNVRNEGADLIVADIGEGPRPAAEHRGGKKKAETQPGLFG